MHTSIHSGGTGNIRHSPRNGLRLLPRSPRGPIALLTPSSARRFGRPRELDACKGAPEPHGFAVRKQARSSVALPASTAPRLTFVTIAKRPSCGGGMAGVNHIFLKNGIDLFWSRELHGPIGLIGLRKLR